MTLSVKEKSIMEKFNELMEKVKSFKDIEKNLVAERIRLDNEKTDIIRNNVHNILIPFVEKTLIPIHCIFIETLDTAVKSGRVSDRVKSKETFSIKIHEVEGISKIFLGNHYSGLMYRHSCGCPVKHINESYLSSYWSQYFGTVESTNNVIESLKEVLMDECEFVIKELEITNGELSEAVKSMKDEIAELTGRTVD